MEPRGRQLLANRYLNRGTAFTDDERNRFGLHGLLPPAVENLETQLQRVAVEEAQQTTDLGRHVFLRALQQRNSVLFYAHLRRHLAQLLPVIYTPTVGLACQQWSRIYRQEHGLYLSWPLRHRVGEMLDRILGSNEVDVIVVTDGERILGLGDLGVGGMGIPIGKLALYTAVGAIDPARTLPVVLDVGTDNEELLSDPLYLGWRHNRLRGDEYDELVDAFIDAVRRRAPGAVVQWEDFAQVNAHRLLERHRHSICSFNDDIQGTAVVTAAAIAAGMGQTGVPIDELRLVIVGAGSAGTGIANQVVSMLVDAGLSEPEAQQRCFLVDRDGLLHDGQAGLHDFQRAYVRSWTDVAAWDSTGDGRVDLVDTVRNVHPHALVGVTGQPGLFTEEVVRLQAAGVDRPIVLPLSNPTPRCEAIPADVLAWTDGRAVVGTGSPFDPVALRGVTHQIAQVNNVYVFPGVGLGAVAVGATAISDAMLTAAASALAAAATHAASESAGPAALLPPVTEALTIAQQVAIAVGVTATREGLAAAPAIVGAGGAEPADIEAIVTALVTTKMWEPVYEPLG